MFSKHPWGHLVGGSLLVAGTSIGAGMLGLPVLTGPGGFGPSIFVYLLCWIFMTSTGLLMLEICLKTAPDANLVSIAAAYFGRAGKIIAWVLYLFLFYCLSIAYVAGGGGMLRDWLGLGPVWAGGVLFVLFLAPFVYFGAKIVDRLNLFLMAGLMGTYLLFVIFGAGHVNSSFLKTANWLPALFALPIIFTSFAYQGVIPTLTAYMKRDAAKIRIAIIAGTSLTFVIYLFWEFLILGIVPLEGLEEAKALGQTAVQPLKRQLVSGPVLALGQAFGFFAVATSYLGVTLGLFDFLADGFRMAKKGFRRGFLGALTFFPPLLIALTQPGIFLTALTYAGGIGCALLLGLLPILMVWKARNKSDAGPAMLPGGKFFLATLAGFVILEVLMELSLIARQ
jgi:tyrosine-specific transport protein